MMHHDDAFASSDEVLADWLAGIHKTKTDPETGKRLTWDSVAGLWFDDADLVRNARARRSGRQVLGSERDTNALNRWEKGLGMQ